MVAQLCAQYITEQNTYLLLCAAKLNILKKCKKPNVTTAGARLPCRGRASLPQVTTVVTAVQSQYFGPLHCKLISMLQEILQNVSDLASHSATVMLQDKLTVFFEELSG